MLKYSRGEEGIFMSEPKRRFDWFGFIIGLISLYAGYLVTWYPLKSLSTLAVIFGVFVILRGVYQL